MTLLYRCDLSRKEQKKVIQELEGIAMVNLVPFGKYGEAHMFVGSDPVPGDWPGQDEYFDRRIGFIGREVIRIDSPDKTEYKQEARLVAKFVESYIDKIRRFP